MKILITGISGFVGAHFLNYLNTVEPGSEVLGVARDLSGFEYSKYPELKIILKQINLLDKEAVGKVIVEFLPQYILHLASVSSVALSWKAPVESFVNNTNIFLNLVDQVRVNKIKCRILSIGSSEEYGEIMDSELPLTEENLLRPVSPYAVARVSQEMLSKIYADGYNLDIVITRSFNHIGPGQKSIFVISSFARQLVMLKNSGLEKKQIIAGNLSIIRDFLDVRDVVRAYYILLKNGKSGEVYNLCSGNGISLNDILLKMCDIVGIEVEISVNPNLIRPNEIKTVIGSYEKIKKELAWQPNIPIEQSVADVIEYWQDAERTVA